MAPEVTSSPASLLFAAYLAADPSRDRATFARWCAEHADLAPQLVSLNEAYDIALRAMGHGSGTDALLQRGRAEAEGSVTAYPVIEEIGRGGMGVVYRVSDPDFGRDLALKRVLPGANRDRFARECRITARLDHPAVVPVHARGHDADGHPWFTMKLLAGEDLTTIIRRLDAGDPAWSVTRVVEVLLRVCDAMEYAHARGVVHRDLKPSNIMVGNFGEVHVMDWGLAVERETGSAAPIETQAAPRPADASATQEGDVLGTLPYMSPEQARGEMNAVDARTDVFALGAILHHVLTGSPPRDTRVPVLELWAQAREGPPEPPKMRPGRSPAPLVAICARAMAADPRARYGTVGALADDLRAWIHGRVVQAYESGPWAEARRWVGRHRTLAALFLVLIVSLPVIGFLVAHALATADEVTVARRVRLQEHVSALVRQGFVELQADRVARTHARRHFDEALALQPDSSFAAIGLVQALRTLEGTSAAASAMKSWLRDHPERETPELGRFLQELEGVDLASALDWQPDATSDVVDIYLRAVELLARGDADSVTRAAQLLRSATLRSKEPVFVVHSALLRALSWQRDAEGVVACAAALGALWPEDAAAKVERSHALLTIARGTEALALAEDAAKISPQWVLAWQAVALAALQCGQHERGLAAVERAEALVEPTVNTLQIKANLLLLGGRPAEAEAVVASAMAKDEAYAPTWFHLNVALMQLGRNEEALEAADKALALWKSATTDVTFDYRGQHAKLSTNRAICLARLGKLEQAQSLLEEALAEDATIATAWATLGAIRSMRGDVDGSIAAARKAVELDPINPQALNNLGSSRLDRRQSAEAHSLLERAVEGAPKNPLYWRNLGIAECQMERAERARAAFEKAVELNPKYEDVTVRLADLLVHAGHPEQALTVLQRFLEGNGAPSRAVTRKQAWVGEAVEAARRLQQGDGDAKALAELAREEYAKKRRFLATRLLQQVQRADPQVFRSSASDAARCAYEATGLAEADASLEFHHQAVDWLRLRMEDLKNAEAETVVTELQRWAEVFPLQPDDHPAMREGARPIWKQFAEEVAELRGAKAR